MAFNAVSPTTSSFNKGVLNWDYLLPNPHRSLDSGFRAFLEPLAVSYTGIVWGHIAL